VTLVIPATSNAGELQLNLSELETSTQKAREIIDRCRAELPPCSDRESREELALAFLIEALYSWVGEGVYDGVAVANARQLAPELAHRWESQFPVAPDRPESWVTDLVPPPIPVIDVEVGRTLATPTSRVREPLTLRLSFASRPFPCRTSALPSTNGDGRYVRDCPVDMGARLAVDVRIGGLLMRLGAAGGGWWTDDSVLLHLMVDTLAELPLTGYYAEGRGGVGLAVPAGPGELRASLGGVVRLDGLHMDRIEELFNDYRVAPPYLSSTSLSAWFALEWEATVEQIRLQPQIQIEVGNEVGWRWRLSEQDLNTYTRNLDADVETLIAPGLGLAVPTSAPIALRLDLVAGVEISRYSDAAATRGMQAQPRLTDTWTTLPRTEFFFHLAVGIEARIGRPRAVYEDPDELPQAPPPLDTI
jgi:hypothetical protein